MSVYHFTVSVTSDAGRLKSTCAELEVLVASTPPDSEARATAMKLLNLVEAEGLDYVKLFGSGDTRLLTLDIKASVSRSFPTSAIPVTQGE